MNYFNGTLLYASAGLKTAIPVFDIVTNEPFTPKFIRVTCGKRLGINESFSHLSIGSGVPESQHTDSIFQDASGGKTGYADDVICDHLNRVSGNVVSVQRIKLHSLPENAMRFEVLAPLTMYYPIYVEAWG